MVEREAMGPLVSLEARDHFSCQWACRIDVHHKIYDTDAGPEANERMDFALDGATLGGWYEREGWREHEEAFDNEESGQGTG